jgi:glutathione synthase/RimK-type ligase-like ATP-grasp enzyme
MKEIFSIAGVRSPKYFLNSESGRQAIMDGHLGEKIFFKTPFHSRGRGMVVYDTKESAMTQMERGYFEESQISDREFRVHVVDGEVICVDEKVPRESGHEAVVKNMSNGYKFRAPRTEYPPTVESESIKAVRVLGLDFGGVDVGVNDQGVWIYEVNTAPSLRTKTRKLYQKAFVRSIWSRILRDKRFLVYVNGKSVTNYRVDEVAANVIAKQHSYEVGVDDVVIEDVVETKSREYNEWLDAQPLTPRTSEL